MPGTLLIVANQPSANTRKLAQAVLQGARQVLAEESETVVRSHAAAAPSTLQVVLREPLQAGPDDVLQAGGLILGTTENFGSISGLMKDFLERVYYPCLESTQGLPYALYVRAGNDGQGTVVASERIITGLRWKAIQPALVLKGGFDTGFVDRCSELGQLMAAGLDAGVF